MVRLSQALLHNDQPEEAVRTVEAEAARLEPGPAQMRLKTVQFMWEGIHAGETASPGRSERLAELAATCTGRDNSERALLIVRGFDAMMRGENAEEIVEICDRAPRQRPPRPGLGWTDSEWGVELLLMLADTYAYTDRLDRAESLYHEALHAYDTAGWSGGHLALAHAYVGLGHRRRGRLEAAEAALRESLRLAERVGRGLPLYWTATCNLVDTLLARGHVDEAWEVAERYGFAPPYPSTIVLPDPRSVRGRLLLAVGRVQEGVNELEAAQKAATARGHHNPVHVFWAADLARALATEDPARAARLAVDVRRQAERFGTDTAIGDALRVAAALETGQRAVRLAAPGGHLPGVLPLPVRTCRGPRRVRHPRPFRPRPRTRPRPGPLLRRGRPGEAGRGGARGGSGTALAPRRSPATPPPPAPAGPSRTPSSPPGTPQYTAVWSSTAPISSGVSPPRRAARTCIASSS
ncbi:hypothetical protein GCM10023238_03800 [Streptomyces heliomycini]